MLVALTTLGGIASADPEVPSDDVALAGTSSQPSHRGVAQDYLVAPAGTAELTADMKFIVADTSLGDQPIRFSDIGLFELGGRYSVMGHLDVALGAGFLAKQPSFTDEAAWQSASAAARFALGRHVAIAADGSLGELLGRDGRWERGSAGVEYRKVIDPEWLSFDLQAGADAIDVSPSDRAGAHVLELGGKASAQFREPTGHWGAWIGLAYAVPVASTGDDPVSGMALDPQPRLDFHLGTVLAIVPHWDLFVDFAVVDRGDLSNPATQLPILDGGFDQRQVLFGVTRHFDPEPPSASEPPGDAVEL
jgi:hypothetical protein